MANNIWKWGTHWNGKNNSKSHYEFMKDEGIVIGIERFKYSPTDLVIITDGFKVKAITMIEEKTKAITENSDYSFAKEKYNIEFENWVIYAKAEWYELPENKVFEYKVQRGVSRVNQTEVKEKVLDLWSNRRK